MINIVKISNDKPYGIFASYYEKAIAANQKNIEAMAVSSFSKINQEVNSRYVNLKIINNKEFIFFSNYESPKSNEFEMHSKVSALFFWNKVNVQIRINGIIKKTSKHFNNNYFKARNKYKNALAISSNQSKKIKSYDEVILNYENALKNSDLTICPDYWGGFSIDPYSFEFWKGHKNRLNFREKYILNKQVWEKSILSP